jgi:pimeloyl-ACP methyl ester carboxylesterase
MIAPNLFRAMAEHADRLTAAQTTAIIEEHGRLRRPARPHRGRQAGRPTEVAVGWRPVRIVCGTKDRTLPFKCYGRPVVAAVRDAELHMLADVGHVPMIDDPEATARAILGFVDGLAPSE